MVSDTGSHAETTKYLPQGEYDRRPLSELEAVVWRKPQDWVNPGWVDLEPCAATLPMTPERMRWCMSTIGWSRGQLRRRIHAGDSALGRILTSKRRVPDRLAIWLEYLVKRTLSSFRGWPDWREAIWEEPEDWKRPEWLMDEPCLASNPMTPDRMEWCLHVVGWTPETAARRARIAVARVYDMLDWEQEIPYDIGLWLEMLVTETLDDQPEPPGWRPKPRRGPNGEVLHWSEVHNAAF